MKNIYHEFLHQHKNEGHSRAELGRMFRQLSSNERDALSKSVRSTPTSSQIRVHGRAVCSAQASSVPRVFKACGAAPGARAAELGGAALPIRGAMSATRGATSCMCEKVLHMKLKRVARWREVSDAYLAYVSGLYSAFAMTGCTHSPL